MACSSSGVVSSARWPEIAAIADAAGMAVVGRVAGETLGRGPEAGSVCQAASRFLWKAMRQQAYR
jgi:hypothetical protein